LSKKKKPQESSGPEEGGQEARYVGLRAWSKKEERGGGGGESDNNPLAKWGRHPLTRSPGSPEEREGELGA